MIKERVDPNSGAILFKKDTESKEMDATIKKLTKKIAELEKRVEKLEGSNKENS